MRLNSFLRLLMIAVTMGAAACSNTGKQSPKGTIHALIPLPAEVKENADSFLIDKQTTIVAATAEDKQSAALFNAYLKELTGYELTVADNGDKNAIVLKTGNDTTAKEGYRLSVKNDLVTINGNSGAGTFYGIQTLIQLLPVEKGNALLVPGVDIADQPRFSYRGLHLDVGRHFFPVDFIKKYIDLLAMHKMNTFHWHLTDDQGWRIEIKKYPRLQEVASKRKETMAGHYNDNKYDGKPYGGYYTQEEVKDVVKYAAERFVTVLPEIEMPGHALAALTAFPSFGCTGGPYETGTRWGVYDDVFCAGNDSVFFFLQDVIDEILPLFPSNYIHIGGDESPKVRWEKCPKCQKRIKDEHLKDEHALQSYFIQRMEKYINSKGRRIIGWDEILEGGLAPDATVMSWRGTEGGIAAAQQGHDVVMTPGSHVYFDYYQSKGKNEPVAIGGFLPVSRVYSFEPVPDASLLDPSKAKHIIGAQANLWTEYIKTPEHVEYMVYPRAVALAEVVWTKPELKNYDNFLERLKVHLKRLDIKKVNYAKHIFMVTGVVENDEKGNMQVKLSSELDGGKIVYTLDSSAPSVNSTAYTTPVAITKSGTFRGVVLQDGKPFGDEFEQTFSFNKATGKTVTLKKAPHEKYNPGSPFSLVNGIQGVEKFNDNQWSAFQGDFEATVDMGDSTDISKFGLSILKYNDQWIYQPKEIVFYVSNDCKTWKEVAKTSSFPSNGINKVRLAVNGVKARYVKVFAKHFGNIPNGAQGAGNPSWLFVDEIVID